MKRRTIIGAVAGGISSLAVAAWIALNLARPQKLPDKEDLVGRIIHYQTNVVPEETGRRETRKFRGCSLYTVDQMGVEGLQSIVTVYSRIGTQHEIIRSLNVQHNFFPHNVYDDVNGDGYIGPEESEYHDEDNRQYRIILEQIIDEIELQKHYQNIIRVVCENVCKTGTEHLGGIFTDFPNIPIIHRLHQLREAKTIWMSKTYAVRGGNISVTLATKGNKSFMVESFEDNERRGVVDYDGSESDDPYLRYSMNKQYRRDLDMLGEVFEIRNKGKIE